jgi:hypothetical protein
MDTPNKKPVDRLKLFDEFYSNKLKPKLFERFAGQTECIKNVNDRFENMIDYNVPHGKKLRGICAYESLVNLLDLSETDSSWNQSKQLPANYDANCLIEQAKAIGWCIEFVSIILVCGLF